MSDTERKLENLTKIFKDWNSSMHGCQVQWGVTFVIVLQRQGLGQASKTILLSPSILCRKHRDEAHQNNDNAGGCEKCNVVAYCKDPLFCQLLISLSMVPPGGTLPGGFVPAVKKVDSILSHVHHAGSLFLSHYTNLFFCQGKRPQDSMTRLCRGQVVSISSFCFWICGFIRLDVGTTPGLLAKLEVEGQFIPLPISNHLVFSSIFVTPGTERKLENLTKIFKDWNSDMHGCQVQWGVTFSIVL
ncbi:hypothetical protein Patl1_34043 [Pistacia atlantica]|uniref:Uncharacterized protein n=1 Tax=Pistacia atlantica TaxID=434234 RepID=A0ACC0ZTV8_9ROSI|nr:hypothetical protein Patl1_34043 [Pistacia atlantica]